MINFNKVELTEKDKATFLTHRGTMHADEVFSTAFLSFLLKQIFYLLLFPVITVI